MYPEKKERGGRKVRRVYTSYSYSYDDIVSYHTCYSYDTCANHAKSYLAQYSIPGIRLAHK